MSKKQTQWIVIIIAISFIGFLLLAFAGRFFIKEIVQDIELDRRGVENTAVAIGEKAPHFTLSDFAGQEVSVSDFLGTPLVLTFWSTWNTVSADQINIFDTYQKKEQEQLFKIITINNQEERHVVATFMRRGSYQVPALLDESGAVGELYEIQTVPTTYFIDSGGVVLDAVAGPISEKLLLEKIQTIVR